MKKTLVAIAALAAFGAQAQSSVTMYGVLDAGVFTTKANDVSQTVLTSGAHTSSRLGFKGTEDIGGGLKANFGLEAGLSVDTGSMGGPSGANGSTKIGGTAIADPAAWTDGDKTADATGNASNQLFSRGAFVGIEGNFGKINAGKISTHSNSFILGYTPGASNIAAVSFRTAATTSSSWLDNTVEYVSPAFSGLTARVLHTTGNTAAASTANESLAAADKKFGNGQEFGLSYVNGPLSAGVYTAERKLQTSAADKAKTNGIGASYNFGVAQVGVTSNESDPTGASTTDKRKGQSVAVTVPLNANVTLGGFFGQAKLQAGAKATFSSLNVDYALSKRTTAYTNYTTVKNSGDGTTSLAGMGTGNAATMGAAAANGTATAFGVGLRHSF